RSRRRPEHLQSCIGSADLYTPARRSARFDRPGVRGARAAARVTGRSPMRPRTWQFVSFIVLLVFAAGCAGPNKLAKQSQQALMHRHPRKADQEARRRLAEE